jgi:hypothetical protein
VADAGPDGLMSAPPGVDTDAGSANTIAATIEAAKAAGMAHVLELSQDTLGQGSVIGDVLPLPGHEFSDTTELQGEPAPSDGPYAAPGPQLQGGPAPAGQ